MGSIIRGVKNSFRNLVRTVSIIIILSVSICMALVMLISVKTVQGKIDTVKSSIGNYITVSPAGIRGFEGGGELLTDSDLNNIKGVTGVTKTTGTLSDRLTNGTNTSLQSAIDAGSFGSRQRSSESGSSAASGSGGNSSSNNRTISMPITVSGTNDLSVTASLNASQFNVTSGAKFDDNSGDTVAMIGTDLATKNSLSVGSTFQAYGKDVKVVGIFDSGNKFTNSSAVMPLGVLQNLSSQSGQYNSIIVQADSIDNVSSVESALKTKLGDKADVVSQQDSSQQAITPLQNIKTISLYSLIGSLVAGSIIIFLTMVMIVRERRREIGVLKAIGASNGIIMTQFASESLVLTLVSSVVGMIGGLLLANPILNVLVNNSGSSTQGTGSGFQGAGRAMTRFAGSASNTLRDLHAVVGTDIILYGLLAAVLIAILGSIIPSFIISRVSPAEVLRSE